MRLDRLLDEVEVRDVRGEPAGIDVVAVTHDSRRVRPGTLFCCVPGSRADGHDFAEAAVDAGAVALLCEHHLPLEVVQAVVDDTRAAMAPVAAALYGHPSRAIDVVGVTGTNGKTTTTHLLRAVLESAGRPARVVGTLSGVRTTPEAPDLQAQLATFRDDGVQAVAIEVSSHALALHRVDATWFAAAVFTNLSAEHLDFHASMEDYFDAKASLFSPERAAVAVVNADDEYGRRLLQAARLPTRPFSLDDAVGLETAPTASTFTWRGHRVRLGLGGVFNVANALAAATTAAELGVDAGAAAEGLSSAAPVAGRYEPVDAGQPFTVVVDYAHTPAGLEQALQSARKGAGGGRVIVVFGCGGDRDRAKRPLMGEIASRLSDVAVITSDNPRGEDPMAIIDEVRAGATDPGSLRVEPDRRAAIGLALGEARPGDVVVVAGKGHETVQVVGDREIPFDDRLVVREELGR